MTWASIVDRLRQAFIQRSYGTFYVKTTLHRETRELTPDERAAVGRAFDKFDDAFKELDTLFRTHGR